MLLFFGLMLLGSADAPDRFVSFGTDIYVYRVSADNQIQIVQLHAQARIESNQFGSGAPLVSPNHRWIAFLRKGDVWLYETGSGAEKQITHFAKPYTKTFASVDVLMVTWSQDSSRLMVNVVPGELECIDCDRPDYKKRRADYGHFVYDLAQSTTKKISVPANMEIVQWFSDGRMLGLDAKTSGVVLEAKSGTARPIAGVHDVVQLSLSDDGTVAAVTIGLKEHSQIAQIDLETGDKKTLSPIGGFADYQMPRISPDKTHVAWRHEIKPPEDYAQPKSQLFVDGKVITECGTIVVSEWIDNQRIIAKCGNDISVLAASGERLGLLKK